MKREYDGTPIDMTWDSGPWANNGETVDVTNSESGEVKFMTHDDIDPKNVPVATADALREQAVNNSTATGLADKYPLTVNEVCDILKYDDYIDGKPTQPPLKYRNNQVGWVEISDDDRTNRAIHNKQFTDSQVADIRERLLDGEAGPKIGEEYGCSKKPVYNAARGERAYADLGIEPPPLKYKNSRDEWVVNESEDDTELKQEPEPQPESEPTLQGQTVSKQPTTESQNYYKIATVIALVYTAYRFIRGVLK